MARASLKQITLRAFRSFADETVLDFDKSGMYLVKGRNNDSNGSSGSGKSSLLLAITYLLGFCRFPATELQSWLTEEPMRVEGVFEVGAGELRIVRGQKLQVFLNDQPVKGGSATLEAEITRHMGIDTALLSALTYRGQKQPGLFLSMTDSSKKEFLTKLLDLGQFEAAYEASTAISRKLEFDVNAHSTAVGDARFKINQMSLHYSPPRLQSEEGMEQGIELKKLQLDTINARIHQNRLRLKQAEASIEAGATRLRNERQPLIDQLEQALKQARQERLDVSGIDRSGQLKISEDLNQAQCFLAQVQAEDNARRLVQRKEADSTYASMMLMEKKMAERSSLQRRFTAATTELEQTKGDLCPTCKRTWEEAQAHAAKLVAEITAIAPQLAEIEGLKPQVGVLQERFKQQSSFVPNPEIDELKSVIAQLQGQLNEEQASFEAAVRVLRAEMDQRIAELDAALQKARAELSYAVECYRSNESTRLDRTVEELEQQETDLRLCQSELDGQRARLSQIRVDNARIQERHLAFEQQLATEQDALVKLEALALESTQKLNAELDFQKLVGREGFLGAIFDEVLWEISDETNQILATFPNTAHVTVNFRSESTTEKGTIKKSIVPVVIIGGHECKLKSGLSGGMETAVELAVDLAVAAVVSRRTGVVPNWLILDESFEGLGPVEKEACMEILKGFAVDKLVFVVDHTSEFKEMFTNTIVVDHHNGKSTIAEVA